MNTALRRQIRETTWDRESLRYLQTVLPAEDAELDAVIGELLNESGLDFVKVVLAALVANRPIDSRHLVKGAGVLMVAGCSVGGNLVFPSAGCDLQVDILPLARQESLIPCSSFCCLITASKSPS